MQSVQRMNILHKVPKFSAQVSYTQAYTLNWWKETIQAKASRRQKNNDQKKNTLKKYSQAIVMFRFDKYFYGNTKMHWNNA